MTSSLEKEVEIHKVRQIDAQKMIDDVKATIASKEKGITDAASIIKEMQVARAKIKPGSVSSQIESAIAEKEKTQGLEQRSIQSLSPCIKELESIINKSKSKASKIQNMIERFNRPDSQIDIDAMGVALDEATKDNIKQENAVVAVQCLIDNALDLDSENTKVMNIETGSEEKMKEKKTILTGFFNLMKEIEEFML